VSTPEGLEVAEKGNIDVQTGPDGKPVENREVIIDTRSPYKTKYPFFKPNGSPLRLPIVQTEHHIKRFESTWGGVVPASTSWAKPIRATAQLLQIFS
jgi:hypothetical protein